MKKVLIALVVIILALALMYSRYLLIETHETLPDEVRQGLSADGITKIVRL